MNCRDDGNAMTQHGVRDLEGLAFKYVEEVHDPAGMARDLFKGLLDKRLWHRVTKVTEPHREQEGMIQQTWNCSVDELHKQPWSPVSPLLVQFGRFTVLEVILVESVLHGDPAVDVQMPRHDIRVVGLRCPRWWGIRVCWTSGVAACHLPDFGKLICED